MPSGWFRSLFVEPKPRRKEPEPHRKLPDEVDWIERQIVRDVEISGWSSIHAQQARVDHLLQVYLQNGLPVPEQLPEYIAVEVEAVERARKHAREMVEEARKLLRADS